MYEYAREGRSAVIGGYIYRGQRLSSFYQGRYFFADFNGRIWSLGLNVAASGEAAVADVLEHTAEIRRGAGGPVSAFGVDSDGESITIRSLLRWDGKYNYPPGGSCASRIWERVAP